MGSIKTPKAPAAPAPMATPEVASEAGDMAARYQKRRMGYAKTLLTGAVTPFGGKKQVLG